MEQKRPEDPRFITFALKLGPARSVRRLFGEREFIDRVGHNVTIRLNRGEEMAFPLPESENLAILKPLGGFDYAGNRVIVEWSYCDRKGVRPMGNLTMNMAQPGSRFQDDMFWGVYSHSSRVGWTIIITFTGITPAAGQKDGYIFRVPEGGFILTHRNGEFVGFRPTDGKPI